MPNFCTKCGNRLKEDSLYCEMCGKIVKKTPPSEAEIFGTPDLSKLETAPTPSPVHRPATPPPLVTPRPKYVSPRPGRNFWPVIIIGAIIIGGMAISGFVFLREAWNPWDYEYLGDIPFSIESKNNLDIELDIENSAGNVEIEYIESNTLFNAIIQVYGKEDDNINDAETFDTQIHNGKLLIRFDSPANGFFDFSRERYHYNLIISIANEVRTTLGIHVTSGNVEIECVKPTTFTGFDVTIGSGNVNLQLAESTFTSYGINVDVSSGNIDFDFGFNATLDSSEIDITHSSGNLHIAWIDIIVNNDISWDIDQSSGGIDITVVQNVLPSTQKTMVFDIGVSSGHVNLQYRLNSGVGFNIDGDTSSGDVNLPNGGTFYTLNEYESALLRLYFDISVSSGNIWATTF
ncbi:MAG: hypothetical protein ACFFCQ_13370 [Promethearchaeota archaeon]